MRMNLLGRNALRLAAFLLMAATAAVRATGFLTLESSPTGAEIWYIGPDDPDKKYLGDTPLESRELPVGRYNLWLILASHDTLAVPDVYIAEGQVTQMNREIPTHYGYLEVATDPDSSEIWLDGVRIGPSPYANNLVLPGTSKLKAIPRESHFKNSSRNLNVGKGDSINITVRAPYRDKNFGHESLSLPEWRFQVESGLEFRSWTGTYLNQGKKESLPTDSADLPSQWDFPVSVRLGLPQDFEVHLQLPFKSSRNPQARRDTIAVFKSNMTAGVKYTYRPLNLGLDVSYGFGFKNSSPALDHDFLALTLMAAGSKGKIYGQAQAGFEFHFSSKVNNKLNPGDVGFAHVQAGYLVDPFTPYLGATAQYRLDGALAGKSNKDVGYILIPEPGFVVDMADIISFQFGVPFTLIGKNFQSSWGLHFSLSLGLAIL
ncbi:MAG: hypothetical protein ABIW76_20745 [Fibrobacteria bacterium]